MRVYRTCASTCMRAPKCRIEVVDIHLGRGVQYQFGQLYNREKIIHFAYDIQNLVKGTTWSTVQYCVNLMQRKIDVEHCYGLVKLSEDGALTELRSAKELTEPSEIEVWLDEQIKSGDVIEIRLKPIEKFIKRTNRCQMTLVHVNLNEDENYKFGAIPASVVTPQFTHYIYAVQSTNAYSMYMLSMHIDFLSDTASFPLVATVNRNECREVVVKRLSKAGTYFVETIWKHGQDLKLNRALKIYPEDVIEIRLSTVAEPLVQIKSGDEALVEIVPDDYKVPEPDADHKECVICEDRYRDVVFKPCNHCCVCMICYKNMSKQECPCCMQTISSWHELKKWKPDKPNDRIIFSTAGMHDVYGLLACLERHF